jgi:peptidoglycan/LPS O-acetylase OafA/YrhL
VEKGIDRLAPLPHPGALAYAVHVLYLATITAPVAVLSWFVVEKPMMNAARRWPHGPPKLTELVPQTLP